MGTEPNWSTKLGDLTGWLILTLHITHSAITTPYYQKNKYSFVHFELEFNI